MLGDVSKGARGFEYLESGKEEETWALCESFPWPCEKGHDWKEPELDPLRLGLGQAPLLICLPALLIS